MATYGMAQADLSREDTESGGSTYRFLRFYHPNASNAPYVISDLGPGVTLGTPLICQRLPELDKNGDPVIETEGDYAGKPRLIPHHVNAKDCTFFLLRAFQSWQAKPTTVPYDPVGAWTTKQSFKAVYKGCKVKEAFLAQVLVLTADGPELAICEVIGPKGKWIRQGLSMIREVESKEFAKDNPDLFKATPGCPLFRVTGSFVVKPKSGDFGPWCYVEGEYDTVSESDLNALQDWLEDSDFDAERKDMDALYEEKVANIVELAGKTPQL